MKSYCRPLDERAVIDGNGYYIGRIMSHLISTFTIHTPFNGIIVAQFRRVTEFDIQEEEGKFFSYTIRGRGKRDFIQCDRCITEC